MAERLDTTNAPVRTRRSRLAAFRTAHPDIDVVPGPGFWESGYRAPDGRMAYKARHELPDLLDDLEKELRDGGLPRAAAMTRGRCDGDCQLITAVVRDMGQADDEELAGIQAAVSDLLGKYESRMGADLVLALCRWREAAGRHQNQRAAAGDATVTPLAGKRAAS
jgi:hypothetical protein